MRKGGSEERRAEKGFLAEVTAQLGADIWRQEDSKRCRSVNPWPWGSMSLRNEVLWGVASNLRGTQWGLCIRIICSPDSGCAGDLTSRPASYPSMWPWDTPPPQLPFKGHFLFFQNPGSPLFADSYCWTHPPRKSSFLFPFPAYSVQPWKILCLLLAYPHQHTSALDMHILKYLPFILSGLRSMGQPEGYYLFFHTLI